ncbi:MAG: AI-2E family transporter [Paracoccaceae bacterium]
MTKEPEKAEFPNSAVLLRWLALIALTVIVTLLFLYVALPFLSAMIMAAIVAGLASPLYKTLLRWLWNSGSLASLATLLVLLTSVVAPLIGIAYLAAGEAAALTEKTVQIYEQISDGVDHFKLPDWVPFKEELVDAWPRISSKIEQLVGTIATFLASSLSHLTKGTAVFFLHLFVFFYAMFFFLQMKRPVIELLLSYTALPAELQVTLHERIVSVSRATIKGTLLIGVVQGSLGGFGFWVAGIEGAIFWAVIMAIASFIPGVGAPTVLVGGAIFLGIEGEIPTAIGLALWATVVVGTIDNVLRPTLVGRDAQLHDLYILVGTLGGLAAFGPVGLVLGPVLAGLFQSVWTTLKELSETRHRESPIEQSAQDAKLQQK